MNIDKSAWFSQLQRRQMPAWQKHEWVSLMKSRLWNIMFTDAIPAILGGFPPSYSFFYSFFKLGANH